MISIWIQKKYVLPYSGNFWRGSIGGTLSFILFADPTVYSSSLPNVQSCTLPCTDNELFKKKKKNLRKSLNGLKEARKKSTGNGLPTPSIADQKNPKKTYFASIGNNKYMVHLIPVQLGTFLVLIPEQQRTSAFKEQPTIPESCVVAQKCCGFRVIKGLLRITTTRLPHRTYKEQDKEVSKHSFFFSFLKRGVRALVSLNETLFDKWYFGKWGLIRPPVFPFLDRSGAVTSSHPAAQERWIR